ncbi:hypothetical protein B296_00006525 [Ensete ventricosum]|uniref:Uncharacterized protein n=1 Tax=Ensete ventricosum TaxID=4639 RepID=A0A427B6V2_ENSVE|nr:hypothetical protein B296_00006525 [Ensete ventricosum]
MSFRTCIILRPDLIMRSEEAPASVCILVISVDITYYSLFLFGEKKKEKLTQLLATLARTTAKAGSFENKWRRGGSWLPSVFESIFPARINCSSEWLMSGLSRGSFGILPVHADSQTKPRDAKKAKVPLIPTLDNIIGDTRRLITANRQEHGGGVAGGPRSEEGGDGPKHHAPRHHSLAPVSVRKCSSGDVRDRITPQERRLPKTSSEKSDELHFLDFRSWQSLHESTLKPVQAMSSLTRKQPQRAPRRQRQCFMVLTSAVSDLTVTFTLWMSHISR